MFFNELNSNPSNLFKYLNKFVNIEFNPIYFTSKQKFAPLRKLHCPLWQLPHAFPSRAIGKPHLPLIAVPAPHPLPPWPLPRQWVYHHQRQRAQHLLLLVLLVLVLLVLVLLLLLLALLLNAYLALAQRGE
jgi:hypothetical protein